MSWPAAPQFLLGKSEFTNKATVRELKNKCGPWQEFKDGDFPYYHWASPIVQEVHVPGHVANSIFIPEHTELVIIKPGEWARNPVYPIQSQEEIHESTEQIVDRDVSDITCLPQRSGRAGNHQPERKARDPAPGVGAAK